MITVTNWGRVVYGLLAQLLTFSSEVEASPAHNQHYVSPISAGPPLSEGRRRMVVQETNWIVKGYL